MSFEQDASTLANAVNALVGQGMEPDEALHSAISKTSFCTDAQADLYARISEAWSGTGLLWKRTVQVAMERCHG